MRGSLRGLRLGNKQRAQCVSLAAALEGADAQNPLRLRWIPRIAQLMMTGEKERTGEKKRRLPGQSNNNN